MITETVFVMRKFFDNFGCKVITLEIPICLDFYRFGNYFLYMIKYSAEQGWKRIPKYLLAYLNFRFQLLCNYDTCMYEDLYKLSSNCTYLPISSLETCNQVSFIWGKSIQKENYIYLKMQKREENRTEVPKRSLSRTKIIVFMLKSMTIEKNKHLWTKV